MPQLPAYVVPQNALWNFQPISDAIDSNRRNALAQSQLDLQTRESARQDEELGLRKQQSAQALRAGNLDYEARLAQHYGGVAQMIDQENDPNKRAAMWQQMVQSHPEFAGALQQHGVNPNDNAMGPKFIMAQARGYQDPLDRQVKQAQLSNINSEIEARTKPQFTTVGHDAYGNPSYGFVDARNQKVSPATMPGQPGQQASAADPTMTGDAYLATLDKPVADQVKAIAEGRMPIPGGFALKTPYWQQRLQMVSQYDPGFDAINYGARAATRKDFTSGKSAQNITSFNTAIGHLDALSKAVDGLGNGNMPWVNAAVNYAKPMMGDTGKAVSMSNFQTARQAVKEELTRAFKGTGGSLAEVEGWDAEIDSSKSPQALKAVVNKATELLMSRIDSVGDQYNRGMGTSKAPVQLLNPKAQAILQHLQSGAVPDKVQGALPPAGSTPATGSPMGRPRAVNPQTGHVIEWDGQSWVEAQ